MHPSTQARKIIERVEEIRREGTATRYVLRVPDGRDYRRYWPIMVAIEMLSNTDLDGATEAQPEGVQIETAGQFAAMWNEATPERREELWKNIQSAAQEGARCFQEDHKGLKDLVARQAGLIVQLLTPAPPEPSPAPRWKTEQTHEDCVHCEAAVELALQHCQETGQDTADWTVTVPETHEGLTRAVLHVGSATLEK